MSIRFEKLNAAFDQAVQTVLNNCSTQEFERAFPQLHRDNPKHLESCKTRFASLMMQDCKKEFEQLLGQFNVKDRLETLDELIIQTQQQENEGNTSGLLNLKAPQDIVQAHRFKTKEQEMAALQLELDELNAENRSLLEQVLDDETACLTVSDEIHRLYQSLVPSLQQQ